MADQRILLDAMSEFTRTLVNGYAISDALFQLSDYATAVLDISGAGVSFADADGVLRFATATSAALVEVERAQERLQQGPCIDAFRTRKPVKSVDVDADTRWSALRPVIKHAEFRSAAALPLRSGCRCLGSLDLYDTSARQWEDADMQPAQLLADMATSYVLNASELERSKRTEEQLQQALDSRIIIEQAKGIIAKANGVTVDQAFQLLRAHARSRNAKLQTVAHAVVEVGLDVR